MYTSYTNMVEKFNFKNNILHQTELGKPPPHVTKFIKFLLRDVGLYLKKKGIT